jgi:hypothetical protein
MMTMADDYRFTPAVQRAFLEVLAETGSAAQAAKAVNKSRAAAYGLRQRGEGEAFRLGWYGAMLIARDTLCDDLMERAIYGQTDVMERDPETGRRVRSRTDNRLGMSMLTRLDNQLAVSPFTPGINAPAWRISQRWSEWLDLVESGGRPHDIMAFLKKGPGGEMFDADDEDDDCDEDDDLDINEQYQLGATAPTLPPAAIAAAFPDRQCQLGPDGRLTQAQLMAVAMALQDPIPDGDDEMTPDQLAAQFMPHLSRWQDNHGQWRTDFPPPHGFDGDEVGSFGEQCYSRRMMPHEVADHLADDSANKTGDSDANGQCQLGADAADNADPLPEAKALDPAQFTPCGTRIYKPGSTTLYTKEYQQLMGFRQIIHTPPPFNPFDGRCTRIN